MSGVNILIDVTVPLPHTRANLPYFAILDVAARQAGNPELRGNAPGGLAQPTQLDHLPGRWYGKGGLPMIRGENITLRVVQEKVMETLFQYDSDIDNRGEFYPISFPSQAVFKHDFQQHGFWDGNHR